MPDAYYEGVGRRKNATARVRANSIDGGSTWTELKTVCRLWPAT